MPESVFESVFEYQSLVARGPREGDVLTDDERSRAAGLRRLLAGELMEGRERRLSLRMETEAEVVFTVAGGFARGVVRDVSGSGMAILSAARLPLGARLLAAVRHADADADFLFPCRVVWRSREVLGVAFDGVPRRAPREETRFAAGLGWGTERSPMRA